MSQTTDDYIAKLAALTAAQKTAERVVALLRVVAPILNNWENCYVDLPGVGVPMGMAQGRQVVDGTKIPPVVDIASALTQHFQALESAKTAYGSMSDAERQAMKAPPWVGQR